MCLQTLRDTCFSPFLAYRSRASSSCASCCIRQAAAPNALHPAAAVRAQCTGSSSSTPACGSKAPPASCHWQREARGAAPAPPNALSSSSSNGGRARPCLRWQQAVRVVVMVVMAQRQSRTRRCSSSCCRMWMLCASGRSLASSGAFVVSQVEWWLLSAACCTRSASTRYVSSLLQVAVAQEPGHSVHAAALPWPPPAAGAHPGQQHRARCCV